MYDLQHTSVYVLHVHKQLILKTALKKNIYNKTKK